MKNKLTIICILLFSAVSLAQEKDTTKVVLKNEVAKKVIKDLIKGDYCELELKQTKKLTQQLEAKIALKDTVINNKNNQIILYQELAESQEKQIKTAKRKTLWSNIILYASLAINGYLLWTKSN
jgi:hypothetical protein